MTKRAGDDDASAFAEAMRGAKPLAAQVGARARVPARPPTPSTGRARGGDVPTRILASDDAFEASATFAIATVGDAIEGRAKGVDVKLLRRLKAGELRVEARLDLHGRKRDDARGALERFVADARAQGRRCVLVVHGRGAHSADDTPVLKPMVWRWLAASSLAASAVLAFASARPAQGGAGATLVLVRQTRR
ncbi:MAG TPA: Smr/MutS family protein [Polyangia bacterium]|nr:Smr/MutS family protein [Polyangia bacterium]